MTKGDKMTHATAKKQGLEPIYPIGHELSEVVFYDRSVGKYYDATTDLYLENFNPLTGLSEGV